MDIKISIVVATSDDNVIGKDNKMPWHIPEDLKHFKSVTLNKPVIMGRNTFQSIVNMLGKPLPKRSNIVVSKTVKSFEEYPEVKVVNNLTEAISSAKEFAQKAGQDEICIIGGAKIYSQIIDIADRIYLTKIHQNYDGDAFFPEIDRNIWTEISCEKITSGDTDCSFLLLEKTAMDS